MAEFDAGAVARELAANCATGADHNAPYVMCVRCAEHLATAAYAAGERTHVEHHRCERCYTAGLVDRSTPDDYERGYAAGLNARHNEMVDAVRGAMVSNQGAYDNGYAAGVAAERTRLERRYTCSSCRLPIILDLQERDTIMCPDCKTCTALRDEPGGGT